jgi:Domain of unknown function (DUF4440)
VQNLTSIIKNINIMKKASKHITMVITMIAMIGSLTLSAQTYSNEQKAVWQEVENKWKNWKTGDLETAFANIDEEYLAWNDSDPMPTTKEKWVNGMKETLAMRSKVNYNIEPARILVRGNAAVVHYYYSFSFLLKDGKEIHNISDQGKWSEFFIKEKGEWLLIGDFTSSN